MPYTGPWHGLKTAPITWRRWNALSRPAGYTLGVAATLFFTGEVLNEAAVRLLALVRGGHWRRRRARSFNLSAGDLSPR